MSVQNNEAKPSVIIQTSTFDNSPSLEQVSLAEILTAVDVKNKMDVVQDNQEQPSQENEASQAKESDQKNDTQDETSTIKTEEIQETKSAEIVDEDLQKEAAALNVTIQQLVYLYQIDGHTAFLMYVDNGMPYIVQSVPRDLGIPPFPPGVYKIYIQVEIPPLPEISLEGPCCTFLNNTNSHTISFDLAFPAGTEFNTFPPVDDAHHFIELSNGAYISYQTIFDDEATLSTYGNYVTNAFSFEFQYFCDANYGQLIFQPHSSYILGLEGLENPADYDTILLNPIAIPIESGDSDCVIGPISCTNPINEIEILVNHDFAADQSSGQITHVITVAEWANLLDFDNLGDFVDGAIPGVTINWCDNFRDVYKLVYEGNYKLVPICEIDGEDSSSASPIVMDLNNNGFELISSSNSHVELNNHGTVVQPGWIGPGDGFLTYNYSGTGPIAGKNFILTENVQGAKTDFQALELIAGQHGGLLDDSNPIFGKLGVWQDSNSNGLMDKGEYQTLSQLGIVSINLTETGSPQNVNGNIINGVLTFNYANGTVGKAADVSLDIHDVLQPSFTIPLGSNSTPPASTTTVVTADPVAPIHIDPVVQAAIDTTVQVVTTAPS